MECCLEYWLHFHAEHLDWFVARKRASPSVISCCNRGEIPKRNFLACDSMTPGSLRQTRQICKSLIKQHRYLLTKHSAIKILKNRQKCFVNVLFSSIFTGKVGFIRKICKSSQSFASSPPFWSDNLSPLKNYLFRFKFIIPASVTAALVKINWISILLSTLHNIRSGAPFRVQ